MSFSYSLHGNESDIVMLGPCHCYGIILTEAAMVFSLVTVVFMMCVSMDAKLIRLSGSWRAFTNSLLIAAHALAH